eukprot:GHRQ01027035.1.p1 GENE.GHRQ01027035.1~~GHRQ01027035.1.p1  ORF type:complete len:126 (+),score=28.70 GHRQ01027035.1:391-768(+)
MRPLLEHPAVCFVKLQDVRLQVKTVVKTAGLSTCNCSRHAHHALHVATVAVLQQAKVEGAHKIPFSNSVYAKSAPRPLLNLETKEIPKRGALIKNAVTCLMRFTVIAVMHTIALLYAPRCVRVLQ